MAELSGYGGKVQFLVSDATQYANVSDTTHNLHAWNVDITADALETTSFADSGDRTYIRGLKGWTATVEGYVDGTNAIFPSDVGTTGLVTLYTDHSNLQYYYGNAILTGVGTSVAVDAVETTSLSLQGTGALTFSDVA